jgi:hypothetical protein
MSDYHVYVCDRCGEVERTTERRLPVGWVYIDTNPSAKILCRGCDRELSDWMMEKKAR